MCRTRALAATAALLLAASATQAHAWPFGKKAAPEAAAQPPVKSPSSEPGASGSWNKPRPATAAGAAEAQAAPAPPKPATREQRATAHKLDPLARSAFWAREVELNSNDLEAGVHLAAALRALGQHEEAAATAERVLLLDGKRLDALLELARTKLAAGKGFYALEPLKTARAAYPNDWRVLSLQGVALEQAQRLPEARQAWAEALRLSPENPQVLTNLALSHMAEGDAGQAETLLRRAAARPDADTRVRQNLALVLGLRGRAAEAERLLREDLPPEQVAKNLAWIRARSTGGARTWGSVQSAN